MAGSSYQLTYDVGTEVSFSFSLTLLYFAAIIAVHNTKLHRCIRQSGTSAETSLCQFRNPIGGLNIYTSWLDRLDCWGRRKVARLAGKKVSIVDISDREQLIITSVIYNCIQQRTARVDVTNLIGPC